MKVRIEASHNPIESRVINPDTGKNVERVYAFQASGSVSEPAKGTLFCYAERGTSIKGDAEIVEVPPSLKDRAREMAKRIGRPEVTAAFAELLGVKMEE